MEERKKTILDYIIKDFIATAEPVGSKFLVEKYNLGISGATVRNEMNNLEVEGFLTHPHTSAGRIPTEKGYRFFVDNLEKDKIKISKKDDEVLKSFNKDAKDLETSYKNLAKLLAGLSGETALIAFSPDRVYYTGLFNLFNKPEFSEIKMVADISAIFDHCEDCLQDFFEKVENEPKFFIGSEHSFGKILSVASFRFGVNSLLALIGLQRMDYKRNFTLMNKIKELI